jgi:DNA-binding LacI/PurR family transcriptional regulator
MKIKPNYKQITIKEIAKIAEVSKGTVSRVINNIPGVGPKTRERIKKLISKYQYEPNAIARSLASKRTGSIGVIIPHEAGYYLSNNYWPILLSVITKAAAKTGYVVILSTSQEEGDVESAFKLMLNGKRIDGIITGSEMLEEKQLYEIKNREIPFVMVGKSPMIDGFYVDIDNRGGTFDLTMHVIKQGYKKLLFICGPKIYSYVQERVAGFHDAVNGNKGIEWRVSHTHYEKPDVQNILTSFRSSGFVPDAVIAGAGDLFIPTYSALKTLDLLIPADIGFASFDKLQFYDFFKPKITAIKQPIENLGETAFEILFKLMNDREPETKSKRFACTLEPGESCGEKSV